MPEPLATTTAALKAAGAAAGVAKSAVGGFQLARKKFRLLGTFDPQWIQFASAENDELDLSVRDVQGIEKFLASPDMEPVLALFAISELSKRNTAEQDADVDNAVEIAVTNQAKRWIADHGGEWQEKIPQVILRLKQIFDGSFANIDVSDFATEIDEFSTFISTPVLVTKSPQQNVGYLERLIRCMTDLQTLVAAMAKARELANAIGSLNLPPILTHTEIEGSLDFEKLYVGRPFRKSGTTTAVMPETLSPTTSPFRVVLMGNPGAGKSTFVRHYKKVTCESSPVPVVEISCRRYAKSTWHKSVVDFAIESIQADHGIRIDSDDFERMLLLGRVCLVFDGLDEITERQKRAEMSARIESIANQYPVCSILVTTRILGYEQAKLPEVLFSHLELDEFNDEQFREYCRNWFRLKDRNDLVQSFLADSDSVTDLRYNPLMLSLLCALYREHGAIPTDRRDVYRQCADLLFRRWDAHRQVEHDSSMPKYAERLMQEIAYWVYSSTAAQAGIEEAQLVKILAHFLRDRGGYDPGDAENASKDFVNFCAGRAWLLGSFGSNKRGQRIFSFTHRTFLEYFAAEALTRRAENEIEVLEKIKAAFDKDRTSVVPELMVQAFDFRKDNGGPLVLSEMLKGGASGLLLLRLMTGVNVSGDLRKRVLNRVLRDAVDRGFDTDEFDLVLNLNPQAREQFISLFLEPSAATAHPTVALLICSHWAGRVLRGTTGRLIEIWDEPIRAAALAIRDGGDWAPDPAIANWLTLKSIDADYQWLGWDALICPTQSGYASGFLWRAMLRRFAKGGDLPTNEAIENAFAVAFSRLKSGARIPETSIEAFNYSLIAESSRFALPHFYRRGWKYPDSPSDSDNLLRQILLWVLCASREIRPRYTFNERLDEGLIDFWPGDFEAAVKLRNRIASTQDKRRDPGAPLTEVEADEAKRFLSSAPIWLRKWFYNEASFVRLGR
ncbi:NACHT domain-containing NTPase [Mycobacterium sp. 1165196.3]|uniref:NACHT domain-containing protein n=1 Tax=Mycobacterium sp. 1165196.3 TaxID=1834071 RepID=UPI0018D44A8C|nr:NACHT domain-containing protein [Mycobacterium sp. 1165196.3]